MIIRSRKTWDAAQPVTGPASKGDGFWVVHYPGGDVNIPTTVEGEKDFLRNLQAYSLRKRRYSLYYGFFIFPSGRAWECRGFDINNAANIGRKWRKAWKTKKNFNDRSKSIHMVVNGQSGATVKAVKACNELIATRDWPVLAHQHVESTSCPGTGIMSQMASGIIGRQPVGPIKPVKPSKPSKPTTAPVGNDIAWYIRRGDTPWDVAATVYGSGRYNDKLVHEDFKSYSTNLNPVHTATPGVKGVSAKVKSGGSVHSTLKSMGFEPSVTTLAVFYIWNGFTPDGRGRILHPGNLVYMPKS
jgi:hypothetical protein